MILSLNCTDELKTRLFPIQKYVGTTPQFFHSICKYNMKHFWERDGREIRRNLIIYWNTRMVDHKIEIYIWGWNIRDSI